MAELVIREIRDEDHETVGAIVQAAYDAVGTFEDPYRSFLGRPSEWVPGTTASYVAEHDGRVVGTVGFVLPGDHEFEGLQPPVGDAGFRFLAVHPDAQGLGAGRALVQRCIDEARARGCIRMFIHSMLFMTGAHRLYESMGFVRRPDVDVVFPSGVGWGFALDLAPDAEEHFPTRPVPPEPPWYEDVWPREDADSADASGADSAQPSPIC